MNYRTKTYIAGDWDGDSDAIQQLYKWRDSDWYTLDFIDAHELKQARDSSLNCSIKRSLKDRLDVSKKFVLVVGRNTCTLKAGACSYCEYYRTVYNTNYCNHSHPIDNRSYIEYECEKAVEAGIKIVVLYNYENVDKTKCPNVVKNKGTHVRMYFKGADDKYYWDYTGIKNALSGD